MQNKQKPFFIVTSDGVHSIFMRDSPSDKVKSDKVKKEASFLTSYTQDDKDTAQMICDLLNSQATASELLLEQSYVLMKKNIELCCKIIPLGRSKGDE